jgi:hypothetical protein
MQKYSYEKGLAFEKECMDVYIKYLESLGRSVTDLTGSPSDYAHKGDILVDKYYVQVKFRSEKYYNYFKQDNKLWASIQDPRLDEQGRPGTSLLDDKSDFIDTVYIVDDNIKLVVRLSTPKFKDWLDKNKHRYTIKTAGRGSGTKGALIPVKDIPTNAVRLVRR